MSNLAYVVEPDICDICKKTAQIGVSSIDGDQVVGQSYCEECWKSKKKNGLNKKEK